MKIDLPFLDVYVAGSFHYKHYITDLASIGVLRRFIYSHKLSSIRGARDAQFINLAAKEYLIRLHLKLFDDAYITRFLRLYQFIWKLSASIKFRYAPVTMVMMDGTATSILRKAKLSGSITIGEAVTAHPVEYCERLRLESDSLGLPFRFPNWLYKNRLAEIELADHILCASQAVRDSYVKWGVSPNKIKIISYGVDSPYQSKTGTNPCNETRKVNILSVARLGVRKGQHHLLNAIKRHRGDLDVHVTLVGDSEIEYMEALRGIGQPFTHIPHVPHSKILEFMKCFDLVVLPSIEDGFGMVISEAVAAGIAVAVSKYAGASEMIAKQGGGRVFDPTDYEDMWGAITACKSGDFPPFIGEMKSWYEYAKEIASFVCSVLDVESANASELKVET